MEVDLLLVEAVALVVAVTGAVAGANRSGI
jgi:hypothetical protein